MEVTLYVSIYRLKRCINVKLKKKKKSFFPVLFILWNLSLPKCKSHPFKYGRSFCLGLLYFVSDSDSRRIWSFTENQWINNKMISVCDIWNRNISHGMLERFLFTFVFLSDSHFFSSSRGTNKLIVISEKKDSSITLYYLFSVS